MNSATSVNLEKLNAEVADMHDADADADRLDFGNQHGREIGAGNRAHATDDHDHEGVADHAQIHQQIGGLARHLHGATKAGKEGAKRKYCGEQDRLIDAKCADHFAVLRRRAHQAAKARLGQRKMKKNENGGSHRDQEQIVGWKLPAPKISTAPRSPGARGPSRSSGPQIQSVRSLMTSTSAKVASSWNSSGAR